MRPQNRDDTSLKADRNYRVEFFGRVWGFFGRAKFRARVEKNRERVTSQSARSDGTDLEHRGDLQEKLERLSSKALRCTEAAAPVRGVWIVDPRAEDLLTPSGSQGPWIPGSSKHRSQVSVLTTGLGRIIRLVLHFQTCTVDGMSLCVVPDPGILMP